MSGNFGVELYDRGGQVLTDQTDLQFKPLSWSASAVGGPKNAEVELSGSRAALKNALLNWLRYRVRIVSPSGSLCWWGYVHEVALSLDGVEITASTDNLRNRIAITYTTTTGAVEQALTTPWADSLASQGEYGVKEHFESLGAASTAVALAYRDRLLAKGAYPQLRSALAGSRKPSATLRCRGHYETVGWRYYQRTDGRLEYMPQDTIQAQPIGWGISASDQIGFGDSGIHDAWGRLGLLPTGAKLAVTGSTSNNKTWTVAEQTAEEVGSYANNTIYFQPSDDIHDAASGMGMVKADHWLLVSGSAANSRWHRVGNAGADHVRTSASVSGAIVAEGTGPTIGLYLAQKMSTVETATYEAPGSASVTVVLHGQQVAQKVTLAAAMKIDRVMVEAATVGAPADNFQVLIYADNAGAIGSLLTSGSLPASALTDSLTAVWVNVTEITLSAGSYWIAVRRSGSNDGQNYFTAGMTARASGSCLMWTGSAWVTHAPGWFLRYRLWAVEDTGKIAETMLQATAQDVTVQGGFLSGVNDFPAMDAIAVVADEVERLVGVGTGTGERVLLDVTADGALVLYARAAADRNTALGMGTADGRIELTDSLGSPWPAGVCPAGLWAELVDIDSDLAAVGGLSPAFIEEATYDAQSGAWSIAFEGERNLADILRVQAG